MISLCLLVSISAQSATPLEKAAASGNIKEVKSLLSKGVDVNGIDEESTWEKTPLFAAAEADQPKIVVLLLSNGANASLTNASGSTPLRVAAYKGHAEVVESLLEGGANPEQDTDYYQRSPLVWALLGARNGNKDDYVNVIKTLNKYGAKCLATFLHPVNDSQVKLIDSAEKSGPEIAKVFSELCAQ